jgi:hypothetical protein
MLAFKISLLFMSLAGCGHSKKTDTTIAGKDTTIIGRALNAKGGAVVVDKNDSTWYIESLDSWGRKVYGKIVKVSGKLVIEIHDPIKPGEPVRQQIIGRQLILSKPKWKLAG